MRLLHESRGRLNDRYTYAAVACSTDAVQKMVFHVVSCMKCAYLVSQIAM